MLPYEQTWTCGLGLIPKKSMWTLTSRCVMWKVTDVTPSPRPEEGTGCSPTWCPVCHWTSVLGLHMFVIRISKTSSSDSVIWPYFSDLLFLSLHLHFKCRNVNVKITALFTSSWEDMWYKIEKWNCVKLFYFCLGIEKNNREKKKFLIRRWE